MPAIAAALLAVGAAAGLVLNKLWIDAARTELKSVAEAAALAAAGEYLGDHLLSGRYDDETLTSLARQRAVEVAASNRVGGQSVELQLGEDTDVVFGKRVFPEGETESVFLLTDNNPEVVEVRTRRTRELGNPINLFFAGVTRKPHGEAMTIAEVAFDNQIHHFSPSPAFTIPALPLAILANDPAGLRTDTWKSLIADKAGLDDYRYDETTHQVIQEADGIPEMILRSVPVNSDPLNSNVQMLEFHNDLNENELAEQVRRGIGFEDLTEWQEKLPAHDSMAMTGTGYITTPIQEAMKTQIGQQKICLLYHTAAELSVRGWTSLDCQSVVAIRILAVIPESDESATIIIQPTVMTTKTAVLSRYLELTSGGELRNPYIYKMYVSRAD